MSVMKNAQESDKILQLSNHILLMHHNYDFSTIILFLLISYHNNRICMMQMIIYEVKK